MRTQKIERVLLVAGLTLLTVWVAARLHRTIGSRAAVAEFEAENTAAPSSKQADAPLAILHIPKINLVVPIFNDTDDLTLNRGVGRILGTAQVGAPGNLGIAGHRDRFFRGLQNIAPGDVLELIRPGHSDRYVVSQIQIVAPEDTSVLNPTAVPTLTLVTCFPFYFVGHAPKRYIVTASLDSAHESYFVASEHTSPASNNTKNKEKKR